MRATEGLAKAETAPVLARLRDELVHLGLAVAVTDGFQSWDLNIVLPPALRAPINALRQDDGGVAVLWRTSVDASRTAIAAGVIFAVLAVAGFSWSFSIVMAALLIAIAMIPAITRLTRVPSMLHAAAEAAAKGSGLSIVREGGVQ